MKSEDPNRRCRKALERARIAKALKAFQSKNNPAAAGSGLRITIEIVAGEIIKMETSKI